MATLTEEQRRQTPCNRMHGVFQMTLPNILNEHRGRWALISDDPPRVHMILDTERDANEVGKAIFGETAKAVDRNGQEHSYQPFMVKLVLEESGPTNRIGPARPPL